MTDSVVRDVLEVQRGAGFDQHRRDGGILGQVQRGGTRLTTSSFAPAASSAFAVAASGAT